MVEGQKIKIAIVGTAGVPSNYGGFETLAENLVKHNIYKAIDVSYIVFCSKKNYKKRIPKYFFAKLIYIPINANGIQSIGYDLISIIISMIYKVNSILLLGVSGAIALPFIKKISSVKIITNIDGIEWRRQKWSWFAKQLLRILEKIAVKYSHEIIADNEAIAEYIKDKYKRTAQVIPYGGDHAIEVEAKNVSSLELPEKFALSICRIEPENNIDIILDAFSKINSYSLVIIGNWDSNQYGRRLRKKYSKFSNIVMMNPIYDLKILKAIRERCIYYIHGHSAGGTNPSLVEAMHFGKPILAYDCIFNRKTTENKAIYFKTSEELKNRILLMDERSVYRISNDMKEIARRCYIWSKVAEQYMKLLIE